jgi:hypothetical protein
MPKKIKVDFIEDEKGCFNCVSHKPTSAGYRLISVKGKIHLLHRFIYEQCFGDIPTGFVIRHKCDNPHCINPEHLEIGTQGDNNRDTVERKRINPVKGSRHPNASIDEEQAIEIMKRLAHGGKLHEIAADFNTTKAVVFKIKHRMSWKHVYLER